MLLEEVISEPVIHSSYYVNQNNPGFGQSNAAMYRPIHDKYIHC